MTAYDQQNLWQRIQGRHGDYVQRRQAYDAQRDVIAQYLRPDLVRGQTGQKMEGAFEGSSIVEGTGPHAALVWQRGFQGNMISRRGEWFREQVPEPDRRFGISFKGNDEVNRYCQDMADHMTAVYRRSNYHDVMGQFTLDGGTVGSPAMLFQNDVANDRIICKVPDYASVWLDRDIFGMDNAIHVLHEWNAMEAADFFGEKDLPLAIKNQLANGNHYAKSKYLQVIYGAGDRIYKGLREPVAKSHPWLEHFICLDAAGENEQVVLKPLNMGPGYFSRPFSTWHYHRNWHEVYSRTMAWWAIYDIRGHNAIWEALFGEAEVAVKPPVWAMATLKGLLDMGPGGGNWARTEQEYSQPPIHLERKTRYDIAVDFADRLAESVRRHFHYRTFLPVTEAMDAKQQPETMFALMKTDAEQRGQLFPQVETYENQVLAPTHDVFMDFELMAEPASPWGRLPEPPAIVQQYGDGKMDVEFIGLLSMAMQRDRNSLKTLRALSGAQMFFASNPRVVNKVRWAAALERFLEGEGFPQADIVPEDEYKALEQALEQRAIQQEIAEAAPKMAQGVKNLQGPTDKKSPLAMMGAK
jgi:hypothetical protein